MNCDLKIGGEDPVFFVPALVLLVLLAVLDIRQRREHRRELARIRAKYDAAREGR